MAELQLKSHRFRTEREKDWKRLEHLLGQVESGSVKSLTEDDMIALPGLYRSTLSSLSVARATSLDQGVIAYLESLSARAYFAIYGTRSSLSARLKQFFVRDWPLAVRGMWKETLASLILTVIAALTAYFLVSNNPDWYYAFVNESLAGGRNPSADTDFLRSGLYDGEDADGLASFAAMLFSHNSRVAILAFALGFALCVPTAALMILNGMMIGGFYALYIDRGLGFELTGWLMIHGTTELFAIILAGGAGFRIGWRLAFPGDMSRLDAAAQAGRSAGTVVAGVVIMLFIAGLIEGFARQLITSDLIRYIFAGTMLTIWLAYFYGPRDLEGRKDEYGGAL